MINQPSSKVYGVINIGTLKTKALLAYFNENGQATPLYQSNNLTCFGCGMLEAGNQILPENLETTIQELLALKAIIQSYQCQTVRVFATHALRDAANRDLVTQAIQEQTGFEVEIIGPEEEGLLYFQAVVSDFPAEQDLIVVDMGGGSCQILIGSQQKLFASYSFKTGGQFLHEQFTHDPHNLASKNTAQDYAKIKEHLQKEYNGLPSNLGLPLVYGSSNIIDVLQAMTIPLEAYSNSQLHPVKTYPRNLEDFLEKILPLSFSQREERYPFQKGYVWGVDKAFLNIMALAQKFNSPYIIPTNVSILDGFLRKIKDQ